MLLIDDFDEADDKSLERWTKRDKKAMSKWKAKVSHDVKAAKKFIANKIAGEAGLSVAAPRGTPLKASSSVLKEPKVSTKPAPSLAVPPPLPPNQQQHASANIASASAIATLQAPPSNRPEAFAAPTFAAPRPS